MRDGRVEHQLLYRLKVYQTYPVTWPNLLSYPPTQTSSPHSLFSDAVVPLVGILILTKAPSALHACSMAITQPDAQHQTRLGANFVQKITIPHSINVLIPTTLIKQENLVTIFHPYATTVNCRTNLVHQSLVCVKNNFYSCAKDDKMVLKHAGQKKRYPNSPHTQ
jgi:hypothetical protein